MKTVIQDVVVLDARNASAEAIADIVAVRDVVLLLLSERTAPLFSHVKCEDVVSMWVVPEDASLLSTNGSMELAADVDGARRMLMVNGEVRVDPAMTPEEIRAQIVGGTVNGSVLCSASQLGALSAVGLQINGSAESYPDGWTLRASRRPVTLAETAALAQGARLYFTQRALLEAGAAQALCAKGVRVRAPKGLLCFAQDAEALGGLYEGDLSGCLFVPDGFKVEQAALDVGARTAFRLRGKLYVQGGLTIREDVRADMLSKLEALRVEGRLIAPLSLMDALLERVEGDAEWLPYEGALLVCGEKMELTPASLARMADKVAIVNGGMLSVDPEIPPEELRARITLLVNDGMCRLTDAQRGALADVTLGGGALTPPDGEKPEQQRETLPPDVRLLEDMVNLKL